MSETAVSETVPVEAGAYRAAMARLLLISILALRRERATAP